MKIIETYNLQKNLMDTMYKGLKRVKDTGDFTDEEAVANLLEIGRISNILVDMRNNSKVKFWLATLLTNLDINVWRKVFRIRKIRKELNL